MREAFAEAIYEAASKDDKIRIVVADMSPAGAIKKFAEEWPERFINVGVAEQNMIGVAAGLAMRGLRPFAYTIATFSLYRPFEMIRDDLCYQNLPVTVVGMGSGVVYSTLGSTHHSQEDIAIAGAIPNMTVLTPSDPLEVRQSVEYCATKSDGPVYLRFGKAGEPIVTENAIDPWEFGKLRYIERGTDVCVMTHGAIMGMALEVAEKLKADGKSVSLVSAHTLKPLDEDAVAEVLRSHKQVIVVEEHAPQGGLSSFTKQIAWDRKAECDLKTFTLKDEFIHCYGSHQELLAKHGLSPEAILAEIA